ncbi:MAG: signal peptidase I [Lachnospiraceae bacterium]|nr:signal peptidase I [Lachnospiraceae bacterium]
MESNIKENNLTEKNIKQVKENRKHQRNKKFIDECLETLLYLGIAFLAAYLVTTYVAQRTVVDGSSMERTLTDKDNLIVDKISYKFTDIKRFDIVVFPYDDSSRGEVFYIKRIIGLPGEIVTITDGKIYITDENGQYELVEDYGYYSDDKKMEGYAAEKSVVLGDDEYFVLGDNRNGSSDSRMIGPVNEKDIIGKAFFRITPFSKFGFIS